MKKLILSAILALPLNSYAVWIEAPGKVTHLITYAHNNTILVTLSSSGTPVADCTSKTMFAISKSIEPEARARMYSKLLAAQVSDQTVTVAYNDVGNCEPWDANASAYRKITRLK